MRPGQRVVLLLASLAIGTRCASPGCMRPLGHTDALSPRCGHPALARAPALFQLSVSGVSEWRGPSPVTARACGAAGSTTRRCRRHWISGLP